MRVGLDERDPGGVAARVEIELATGNESPREWDELMKKKSLPEELDPALRKAIGAGRAAAVALRELGARVGLRADDESSRLVVDVSIDEELPKAPADGPRQAKAQDPFA